MFRRFFFKSTSNAESSTGTMGDNKPLSQEELPKTEEEWKKTLSPEQFRILRLKGTEPPGSGIYNKHKADGVYLCAGCNTALYESKTKFDSGCGWPAFYAGVEGKIKTVDDHSHGMIRTEIMCSNCGGHLGHVFRGEGFPTPTDERHCVNSVSIKFVPK